MRHTSNDEERARFNNAGTPVYLTIFKGTFRDWEDLLRGGHKPVGLNRFKFPVELIQHEKRGVLEFKSRRRPLCQFNVPEPRREAVLSHFGGLIREINQRIEGAPHEAQHADDLNPKDPFGPGPGAASGLGTASPGTGRGRAPAQARTSTEKPGITGGIHEFLVPKPGK